MTFLLGRARAVVAIGALTWLAPGDALAFCRTTTVPIPASYSPTRGCFEEGLPLFWGNACVGFSINEESTTGIPLAEAQRVIGNAFASWSDATCADTGGKVGVTLSDLGVVSCAEVRYNKPGPNQNLVVFRTDSWPYSDPNNTLGLTTVTFNAEDGEIFDADMEINASGANLSTAELVPLSGFDLLSVVTHEAGHFLGIAHATDPKATMYASYRPGSSAQRTLLPDDIAGACAIYPDATSRVVPTSVEPTGLREAAACDPTPRRGYGTTCSANPAPVEEKPSGCSVSPPAARAAPSGVPRWPGFGAPLLAFAALAAVSARLATRRRR